ncbi:MAG: phosphopentomutase, partial [Actinomycetia bacterium]|nr:phosphopentomutase [Actinomycetes bacterium]
MVAAGRFIFLVLDGVGIGALPDAADYGDAGSDTLGNLARVVELHLPNFERLGLGDILPVRGVFPTRTPLCLPGRLAPKSVGKDTTVGHWEHMGLVTARPFPTYPQGFPREIIDPFTRTIGRDVLGNRPASGTAIIAELGAEHLAT